MLRNPRTSGGGDSRPPRATHTGIRTPTRSTAGSPATSTPDGTLPYHVPCRDIQGFGGGLEPRWIVGAAAPRPVSYYALFQGWLLLSQPPGCLRAATSFPTEPTLRDLSRWSGLFPSRRRIFAPAVSLRRVGSTGIRSLARVGRRQAPSPNQCSTPARRPPGLHLNAFRGEPAISGFDWHFTPTHNSSEPFATDTGSALHRLSQRLQPGHG